MIAIIGNINTHSTMFSWKWGWSKSWSWSRGDDGRSWSRNWVKGFCFKYSLSMSKGGGRSRSVNWGKSDHWDSSWCKTSSDIRMCSDVGSGSSDLWGLDDVCAGMPEELLK